MVRVFGAGFSFSLSGEVFLLIVGSEGSLSRTWVREGYGLHG